ncbi:MAG: hypothetical protein GKC53_05945 [Neisseriaceae bacterium]|nr:MAG: hypothetical protein GKC53_05945 [Neisseriaceae bacterium]
MKERIIIPSNRDDYEYPEYFQEKDESYPDYQIRLRKQKEEVYSSLPINTEESDNRVDEIVSHLDHVDSIRMAYEPLYREAREAKMYHRPIEEVKEKYRKAGLDWDELVGSKWE